MNVFYTRELDTHDSAVVKRVLFDANTNDLYLVFHNGTVVVRTFTTFAADGLDNYIETFNGSWGRAWNSNLKHLSGENLGSHVSFTKRVSVPVAEPATEEVAESDLYMVSLSALLPREVALKVMNALLPIEKALHDNYGDFYSTISISTTPEETE